MKLLITLLSFILAVVSTPAWSNNKIIVETKKTYTPNEVITYKTTPQAELKLDVFYPNGEKKGKNRTVVVQFFGGGWASGNTNQFYQQSGYYNAHGIVAISVDYRVISKHKITPFECVEDAKSAIRYIREHAKELGIDPKKIIASGGSAGGHLAACTAIIEGYDNPKENLKVSSVPNALILFNPVLDTTKKGYGANKLVGKETLLSPTHHVRKNLPPTIVMHGTKDTTVPYTNATEFVEKMKKCGNSCELVPFEGVGHGFFNGVYFRAKNGDKNFNICMERAVEFISKCKL